MAELYSNTAATKWQTPIPVDKLTPHQRRSVLALVIETVVLRIFQLHCYTFKGVIYKQKHGRAIGLRVTGSVARIVMDFWATAFLKLLDPTLVTIFLFTKYVDDMNMILRSIPHGYRWTNGKFVWTQEVQDEDNELGMSNSRQMMNLVLAVANSIFKFLTFTADLPEDNNGDKVPILDMCVWTECVTNHPSTGESHWRASHHEPAIGDRRKEKTDKTTPPKANCLLCSVWPLRVFHNGYGCPKYREQNTISVIPNIAVTPYQ